jgi:homocysteine S-methyltransferase
MPIQSFFEKQGVLIIDGALASELERRGADLRDALWSAKLLLEQPDLIRAVHYDYYVAGADVAITASYQASFEGFALRGLSEGEAADLMRLSVQLACEARDDFWAVLHHRQNRMRPLVAASIGSYGAYLADGSEYRGDYGLTSEELEAWHRPRMTVLAASGADLLACETIPCLLEGQALITLLQEFPETQAWLSYSCCDATSLCHGEEFAQAVALANDADQVVATGLNCTPPRFVEELLGHAARATPKPLLAYPNSGETWDEVAKCWIEETASGNFAGPATRWHTAGARLIGGCCRTQPEDIYALRQALVLEAAS